MPEKIKFCKDLSANTNTVDGSKFGRLQEVLYSCTWQWDQQLGWSLCIPLSLHWEVGPKPELQQHLGEDTVSLAKKWTWEYCGCAYGGAGGTIWNSIRRVFSRSVECCFTFIILFIFCGSFSLSQWFCLFPLLSLEKLFYFSEF